jgi:hypothetical protein
LELCSTLPVNDADHAVTGSDKTVLFEKVKGHGDQKVAGLGGGQEPGVVPEA